MVPAAGRSGMCGKKGRDFIFLCADMGKPLQIIIRIFGRGNAGNPSSVRLHQFGDAAAPKLADLARMAGIAPATAQDSLAAEAFIDWVDRMNAALGIPKYVTGIRRSDIPQMAAHADAEANPLYPVPLLMDRLELERMYEVVAGGMFEDEN